MISWQRVAVLYLNVMDCGYELKVFNRKLRMVLVHVVVGKYDVYYINHKFN